MGNLCGYVGVPRTHPAHGKPYSITSYREELHDPAKPQLCAAINSISAHGGLTYANACQSGGDESEGICHVPAPGEPDDVWWFGFDCAHCFDLMPGLQALCLGLPMIPGSYRTVDYVAAECADLARQLAAIEALTDVAQAFDEAAREAPL